jgi:hypothetical protein
MEETFLIAVAMGLFRIDPDGSIWRIATMYPKKNSTEMVKVSCVPRRLENDTGVSLQVRWMHELHRIHVCAARVVWVVFFGPIPEGKLIGHRDGNYKNNHPENLELCDRLDIAACGENNSQHKLTVEQVREIRERRKAGQSVRAIAEDYPVCQRVVECIVKRRKWRTV